MIFKFMPYGYGSMKFLMKTKVFCPDCGQYVPVKIKERDVVTKINGIIIKYVEQYAQCKKCHNEVYMFSVNDTNCYRRYIAYEKAREFNETSKNNRRYYC